MLFYALLSFLWDCGHPQPQATYPLRLLTSRNRTGSPASDEVEVYMVLQPIRCTASHIAMRPGELLPHLFTLTPPKAWR